MKINNKTKIFLGVLIFIILIGAAYLTYNSLQKRYDPIAGLDIKLPIDELGDNIYSEEDDITDDVDGESKENKQDSNKQDSNKKDQQEETTNSKSTSTPVSKNSFQTNKDTDKGKDNTKGGKDTEKTDKQTEDVDSKQTGKNDETTNKDTQASNKLVTSDEEKQNNEKQNNERSQQANKTKAPDFTIIDSNNNSVKLSDFFGKPIVLNFWASWCPPCKSEMPDFNEVYGDVKGDITFMMVDLVDGQRETVDKGKKYIQEQGFKFPVYYDSKQEAAYAYGIQSIPTTIFIDKDGYIVTGIKSAINKKTLLQGIDYIR